MTLLLWQKLVIVGIVLVILEVLTPTTFFITLALASFVTAAVSTATENMNILVPIWVVSSLVFLVGLRIFSKKKEKINAGTGMGRYIGQRAVVLEEVDTDSGVVRIFDERWNARSADKKTYEVGEKVYIKKEENLVLYVGKEK